MYGKGIHSIRWRFTLAIAAVTATGVLARDLWFGIGPDGWPRALASVGALVVLSASATYWMASRLTRLIAALERSTRAIAAGDFDRPVEIDCQCEFGGLADSFRTMTRRLNANVLRMNALAYTDAITGLPNRAVITQVLEFALAPERPGRFEAAILFIDLDGFKRINDTLGHRAGDELLKAASLRLLERGLQRTPDTLDSCMDDFGTPCRRLPEDIVFVRFAGDEFVAVVPGLTDRGELSALGERLLASLEEPFTIAGRRVCVGASIGIAVTPEDTRSATELLSFADLAMYSSKQAGKARFRFFDRKVRAMMVESADLEADLRLAIERDQLRLHFQPNVDACSLSMAGVEALVRWQHPRRGLLPPSAFIDLAERTGLMTALGAQVVTLAARQCRAWLDRGIEQPVSINVSPSQFVDPDFVPSVLKTLAACGTPSRLITLEITETIAMTDFEATVARLTALRAAGITIALDDFGIGFSNLSMLSRLPLDKIKIDRSLVREIGASPKSEAIIQAILGISRGLGLTTIAEGIETEAQLEWLRLADCDTLQGFLFASPMAASDLDIWSAQRPDVAAEAGLRRALPA